MECSLRCLRMKFIIVIYRNFLAQHHTLSGEATWYQTGTTSFMMTGKNVNVVKVVNDANYLALLLCVVGYRRTGGV